MVLLSFTAKQCCRICLNVVIQVYGGPEIQNVFEKTLFSRHRTIEPRARNTSPVTSVVQENSATLFYCEAPEMFLEGMMMTMFEFFGELFL